MTFKYQLIYALIIVKIKKNVFHLLSILLIVLFVTISLSFWESYRNTNRNQPYNLEDTSNLWVYNCELPEQKPKTMLLTCADGGIRIEQLTWSAWSSNSAFGYGTYLENNCEPDCSEGKYTASKVTIKLDQVAPHKGKLFFKILKIASGEGSGQSQNQFTSNWDIFSFGKMMNE